MEIVLKLPDSLIPEKLPEMEMFLQCQLNRLALGHLRYGCPDRRQSYMRRLEMELEVYKNDGNFEQLINIANYAILESIAPQNNKLHFDPTVASVTREKIGWHRA